MLQKYHFMIASYAWGHVCQLWHLLGYRSSSVPKLLCRDILSLETAVPHAVTAEL